MDLLHLWKLKVGVQTDRANGISRYTHIPKISTKKLWNIKDNSVNKTEHIHITLTVKSTYSDGSFCGPLCR